LPTTLNVELMLNAEIYRAGDRFLLVLGIGNGGPSVLGDLFIILDVYGEYWFWPSWTQRLDYDRRYFDGETYEEMAILDFTWPAGVGSAAGLRFWSAITETGGTTLLSNVDFVEFGYM
jgi:hypothetical protein